MKTRLERANRGNPRSQVFKFFNPSLLHRNTSRDLSPNSGRASVAVGLQPLFSGASCVVTPSSVQHKRRENRADLFTHTPYCCCVQRVRQLSRDSQGEGDISGEDYLRSLTLPRGRPLLTRASSASALHHEYSKCYDCYCHHPDGDRGEDGEAETKMLAVSSRWRHEQR